MRNTMRSTYKYDVGQVVNKLKITKQLHELDGKYKKKKYEYVCTNCGNSDKITEDALVLNKGCNACCTPIKKVVENINSIYHLIPELNDYFVDIQDAKTNSVGSGKKVKFKCPQCGYVSEKQIYKVCSRGFSCSCCSDGKSIPEKFMGLILKEANIDFETEKIFEWGRTKRYDFYLPKYNMIIETHGKQHYNVHRSGFMLNKTYEEEKKNDDYKKNLALDNGVENYIVIDCRESDFVFLHKNIEKSLGYILNLTEEQYRVCFLKATRSFIGLVCQDYNNGITNKNELANKYFVTKKTIEKYLKMGKDLNLVDFMTKGEKTKYRTEECANLYNEGYRVSNIAKKLNLHESGVRKYLQQGSELGLCAYIKEVENRRDKFVQICEFYHKHNTMPIKEIAKFFNKHPDSIVNSLKRGSELGMCSYEFKREKGVNVYKDNVLIETCDSAKDCVEVFKSKYNIKLNRASISSCCNGKRKSHKGFTFEFEGVI